MIIKQQIQKLITYKLDIIKKEKLKPIIIQFKQVQKGRARYKTRKITIPLWVLDKIWEYQIYYIIHELSHFINYDKNNNVGHNNNLKQIEQRILEEYNIILKYKKAYPKWLYNAQGDKICDGFGQTLTNDKV